MTAPADAAAQKKKDAPAATVAAAGSEKQTRKSDPSATTLQKNSPAATGNGESPQKVTAPVAVEQNLVKADIFKINEDFKKRKQIVSKQIEVSSDSLRLSFYDNAEVDGDSISVFLNGKLVMAHQALSERAFNVYLELDTSKEINEVSMFAENLGRYPPNTALMVISDGDKRYETFLSSDFKGNATIRLKLKRNSFAGNQ